MVWRVLGALLLLAILAALGVAAYAYTLTRPTGGGKYTLEVRPGDTLAVVTSRLERAGIVRSADAVRLVMRANGTAGRLKEGYYDLSGAQDALQVADTLAGDARPRVVNVTIPEGRRLKDLPPIFAKAGFTDAAGLNAALNDAALSRYARGNLEGFLFPATYPFRPEATPKEIVEALVGRMQEEFTPANVARAKALGLGVRDWVILASLVQAEAGSASEMPSIAGVFLNRLQDGMPLGSDPTVAYGLGKDLPELDRYAGDFKKDTPYNTYTRAGLPAGPINNPGAQALMAVLSPKRTAPNGQRALYFLHGLKGEFRLNSSYAAHLRDVDTYR